MTDTDEVLEYEQTRGVHVLRVRASRLDSVTPLMVMDDELDRILKEDDQAPGLVINLGSVEYLVTIALAKLITCREKIVERGGTIGLCSLQPAVAEMMEVTRFNELFEIYEDEAEAIEGMAGPA